MGRPYHAYRIRALASPLPSYPNEYNRSATIPYVD